MTPDEWRGPVIPDDARAEMSELGPDDPDPLDVGDLLATHPDLHTDVDPGGHPMTADPTTAPAPVPLRPVPATAWRAALKGSGLPPTAILVGHRLCDFAADEWTEVPMPGLGALADAAEVPLQVARRCVTALTAAGWIVPAVDHEDRRVARLLDPTGGSQ